MHRVHLASALVVLALVSLPSAPSLAGPAREPNIAEGQVESLTTRAAQARAESFTVVAVNTNEEVVVHFEDGRPDFDSITRLRHAMRCLRTEAEGPVDMRLVEALHRIAAATGSKIDLISAFRSPTSLADRNYHTRGMAADIRVPGVTTSALRELSRTLRIPGIGYYPTSKMVHVDVRDEPYSWTDWSGPPRRRVRR